MALFVGGGANLVSRNGKVGAMWVDRRREVANQRWRLGGKISLAHVLGLGQEPDVNILAMTTNFVG